MSQWSYAVFASYGGGAVVDDYSAGGAWVAAGTGGHNAPENPGAAIFDFADATWKIRRPQDTQAVYRVAGYRVSETNGAPWYEINGTSQVPAPAHAYATLAPLPAWLGGGSKGSVIYFTRAAVAVESVGSQGSHEFDLATGIWRRKTAALSPRAGFESDVVFDATRRCYWLFTNRDHAYNSLVYLDARDWTVKTLGSFPYGPEAMASGRVHLFSGLLVRLADGQLWAIDPDRINLGWKRLAVSGVLPPSKLNRFAEWRGKLYWLGSGGGNTLYRLTPPADPWNGTWVGDTITVSGPTLPAHAGNGFTAHYTGLMSVRSIDSLAWIPGDAHRVYLIRPE
jgi:hypothetical protein